MRTVAVIGEMKLNEGVAVPLETEVLTPKGKIGQSESAAAETETGLIGF